MQFLACKLTAAPVKIQKNRIPAVLLLSGRLLISAAPVLQQGCATEKPVTNHTAQTPIRPAAINLEPYYIAPEVYEYIKNSFVNILGPDRLILDAQEPVKSLRSLFKANAVSFTIENMPRDMERILKKYKTNDDYGNYYNFVAAILDRIIFCPNIHLKNAPSIYVAYGITLPAIDARLYPGERNVYINTFYNNRAVSDSDSIIRLISDVVHEAAHKLFYRLYQEGQLSPEQYALDKYNERAAYIIQLGFLHAAARDPEFAPIWDTINWHIRRVENMIAKYNTDLGLPRTNRTLWPEQRVSKNQPRSQ